MALLQQLGILNGNPLQCSCLENPRDGGAWWAAVYGVAQSRTRLKRLSSSSSSMLSCCGGLPLFWPFLFFLKGCQEHLPLTTGLLKLTQLVLEFTSPLPAPGHFLRRVMLISVINRNPAL